MANKTLSTVTKVKKVSKDDTIVVEQSGGVRRISVDDFSNSIGDIHTSTSLKTYYNNPSPDYDPTLQQSGNRDVIMDYLSKCKAYVFNSDGTKKAEILRCSGLDPTNVMDVFFTDGTSKTIDALNTAGCNFMVYRPELGILSTTEDDRDVLYFAGTSAIKGGYQMRAKYIGMFKGYKDGSVLKSQPNRIPTGGSDTWGTIADFQKAAQAGARGYGLFNFIDWNKEQAIHLSYFGNTNYQVNVGTGRIGDGTKEGYNKVRNIVTGYGFRLVGSRGATILPTGPVPTTDSDGAAVNVLMFFGLEGLGEQIWEFLGGIRFDDEKGYFWDFNSWGETTNDTTTKNFTRSVTGTSGGYVMKIKGGPYFNCLPEVTVASNAANAVKGYCDGGWYATAGRVLMVGGYASYGSRCGLAASHSTYGFASTYSSIGARLAFWGDPQTVSGSELLN